MLNVDITLFKSIYTLPHPVILNFLFIFLSTLFHPKLIFMPLVIGFLLFHHKKLGWIILEAVYASGFAAVASQGLKYLIDRPRPGLTLENVTSLDSLATGTSFPSIHAAFIFGLAFVFSANTKKLWVKIAWYLLAILVCFSRIWLGAHYPVDVLAGALLGIIFGFLSIKFTPYLYKSLTRHRLR